MQNLPVDHFVKTMTFTRNTYTDQYPAIDPSSPELSQKGKVVVITGASRGIGARGFAPNFARAGPKAIVLIARDINNLQGVEAKLKEINPDVQLLSIAADVTDQQSIEDSFKKINEQFGHADILVNNAALGTSDALMRDTEPSKWWREFEVNVRGTFLVTQQFLKALPEDKQGTVLNITSGGAYLLFPTMSSYSFSKMAVLQMADQISIEHPNVTAIAIHPGIVQTDMTGEMFKRFANDTPDLVGGLAVWLSTDKAKFLRGRFVNTNWDVEELYERREEIEKGGNLLKADLQGTFGQEQFQSSKM